MTSIREQILEKARLHLHNDEIPEQDARDSKGRIKYPNSKVSDNPEGLYEAQLKHQSQIDKGVRLKCKRRQLKELSHSMWEAIVHAYTKENMLQKEIATRFRVKQILVSRLVCEARE